MINYLGEKEGTRSNIVRVQRYKTYVAPVYHTGRRKRTKASSLPSIDSIEDQLWHRYDMELSKRPSRIIVKFLKAFARL